MRHHRGSSSRWGSESLEGKYPTGADLSTSTEKRSRIADRRERPFLDRRLGGWIGAILAECSVQSLQSVNLKELPGSASLATATFAAARGIAVWGDLYHLRELAERYEELGSKLRENTRVISAMQLLPIWHTLNGHFDPLERNSERKALEPFVTLLEKILLQSNTSADAVSEVVRYSLGSFGLPVIAECSRGPQLDRVRAVADDREIKRKLTREQSEPDLLSPLRQTGDRTPKKK